MKIPNHLKKYLIDQNYKKYTEEDQAVWRYIMKKIEKNLSVYGYRGISSGMKKSGISFDKIPKIKDIDKRLQNFGWRAVTISGFIPPKAFMEFQKNQILPIASELRSIEHLFYTPAPDIVHEAVGHVPFLSHSTYSRFLKKYAEVVLKSLSSSEDKNQYTAIRELSDLKENSQSTKQQILKAEKKLETITKNMTYTSESSLLSRFIWWTSEYGLIGDLKNPKIYGAGLISSIEETQHIHKVKKINLDESCLKYSYDITKLQPQLFVAKNFSHLLEVLDNISEKLAWKQGGIYGAKEALKSQTINTIELDNGLQISGILTSLFNDKSNIHFLKFSGPCQLSFKNKELKGHGKDYHSHGYSSPLKLITKNKKPFYLWTKIDLSKEGLKINQSVSLKFEGNIYLQGELIKTLTKEGRLLVLTFKNCSITKGDEILFDPSWGFFDLVIANQVTSVFSGAADPHSYKEDDDFQPSKVSDKQYTQTQIECFKLYKKVQKLKTKDLKTQKTGALKILEKKPAWLAAFEILEIVKKDQDIKKKILSYIKQISTKSSPKIKKYIQQGLSFYQ